MCCDREVLGHRSDIVRPLITIGVANYFAETPPTPQSVRVVSLSCFEGGTLLGRAGGLAPFYPDSNCVFPLGRATQRTSQEVEGVEYLVGL